VRRILLTLILAIVVLAASVSPALAQVVVSPSSAEPCPYTGPVAAEIFNFVNLTPCDVQVVND